MNPEKNCWPQAVSGILYYYVLSSFINREKCWKDIDIPDHGYSSEFQDDARQMNYS